ncbi:MAG TPA: hypothetical protein VIV60_05060 [Polyangiaceae bacterium]
MAANTQRTVSRSKTKVRAPARKKPIEGEKRALSTKPKRGTASRRGFIEDNELSPGELRELERRVDDLNDRSRFMLVTMLGPGFVLYYNVSEDTYGWNDPAHATLFKRRPAASAIQQLLGENDAIVPCTVNARGELVKKSVKLPATKSKAPSRSKRPR